MPDNTKTQDEANKSDLITNPEILYAEPVETEKTKKPFYKSFKFISSLILLIIFGVFIIWLVSAFSTYRNAKVYKGAYEKVNEQRDFCRDALTKEVKVEIVDYCREFTKRFENVDNTQTK